MFMSCFRCAFAYFLLILVAFSVSIAYAGDYWDVSDAITSRWKLNELENDTTVHEMISYHHGVASILTRYLCEWDFETGWRCFNFNGDRYVTVSNHPDFSFGNGTNDRPFSVSAWVYITDTGAIQQIVNKWDNATPLREWAFYVQSDETLVLHMFDESLDTSIYATSSVLTPGWHFVVGTYDGSGANGITLYVDGGNNTTATYDDGYVAMDNQSTDVCIGAQIASSGPSYGNFIAYWMANVCIFDSVLSDAEVSGLYNNGEMTEDLYGGVVKVYPGGSIQDAIDRIAVSGDTVLIHAGTYYEDIVMKDGVDIIGELYGLVVIKGRVLFKDATCAIEDITIVFPEETILSYTNNYYLNWILQDDAGITVINSIPTIQNCVITPDLEAINYAHPETPDLEYYGRGIQIWNMYTNPDISPHIENNLIKDTEYGIYYFSQNFGGAILGQIKNNTFYHNKNGLILRMHKEKPEIKNNIITSGDTGIFLTYRDDQLFDDRINVIHHNDIWGTIYKYWLDAEALEFDLTGINGNISEDPLFVDPDNYDFSLDVGSPCIGAADDGGDMGAQLVPPVPPSMPTVSPIPSPTNQRFITIAGTKDINTSIIINGVEYVAVNSETNWTVPSYDLGADGDKILMISSENMYAQGSGPVVIDVTLDTILPNVTITSPLDGAIIDTAPITVTGTIDEPCDVLVNGVLAAVEGINFTAEDVDLRLGANTITATAYDIANNISTDTITITSTVTSDYDIAKLTSDVYEYDPTDIVASSQYSLMIQLEIDGSLAENEPIEFLITQGNGSMVQSVVNTDLNGEATGVLNTDTDASVTNLVDVFDQNFPSRKVAFHVDTKEGPPANLVKLTDESVNPAPGTDVDLVVRLEDSNNNPIPDEEITFQITSGPGSLSSNSDTTRDYGNASVILTTTSTPNTSCTVQAQCVSNPALIVDFVITTSDTLLVTINDIDAKVELNNSQIQDIMADVHVTSDAPWLAPVTELKIWRKDIRQRTDEISPEPGVYIKSAAAQTAPPAGTDREIIAYDPATNVYTIKTMVAGQTEEYPYEFSYVDYDEGAVKKVGYYVQDEEEHITKLIKTASNYILLDGAWVFQTLEEEWSSTMTNTTYTTTSAYTNIVVNSGIPDSIFEE